MKRWWAVAAVLACALLRLCHLRIVWVEEAYPAAAAIQMGEFGKMLYRDIWFDKPPGAAYFYRLFDALPGWPLRLAGIGFVVACGWLAYMAARRFWGEREGLFAAVLAAFALTFDHPAAVMAIAPDLLMVLPQLAALALIAAKQPVLAGVACGVAFWVNPKAAFVVVVCVLWTRSWKLAAAALVSGAVLLAPFAEGWYEQVWLWGRDYSRDTPFADPLLEGLKQTGSWMWFHLTLCAGVAYFAYRENRRWLLWIALQFCAVTLGLRFAPRYYFQLLPVMVLPAARGLLLMPARLRALTLALLLIPGIRFGRQYAVLAADLAQGRAQHSWNQLELANDSREAAQLIREHAKPGDTLLVWGYRPDIHMLARLPLSAGAPFLDSQPVNGVLADRHLVTSKPSAMRNLRTLGPEPAVFVADGLGLLNPALALHPLETAYREIGRTKATIVYQHR